MNNTPGFLDLQNSERRAQWVLRWHQQGGSHFWCARDLQDLRDEDLLRRWRWIEIEVRNLRRLSAPVVHIATARLRKMRRQA